MVTLDLSMPLTAIITIGGVAWILHRYILGVKIHIGNRTYLIEKARNDPPPPNVYLSNQEEIDREFIRQSKESAISKR